MSVSVSRIGFQFWNTPVFRHKYDESEVKDDLDDLDIEGVVKKEIKYVGLSNKADNIAWPSLVSIGSRSSNRCHVEHPDIGDSPYTHTLIGIIVSHTSMSSARHKSYRNMENRKSANECDESWNFSQSQRIVFQFHAYTNIQKLFQIMLYRTCLFDLKIYVGRIRFSFQKGLVTFRKERFILQIQWRLSPPWGQIRCH